MISLVGEEEEGNEEILKKNVKNFGNNIFHDSLLILADFDLMQELE